MFEEPISREKLENILATFRREVQKLLGDQLEAVYLYGSRARGDARPNSDVDMLVVLRGDYDYEEMLGLTSDVTWRLSLENDIVITRVFVSKEKFELNETPFLANVRRDAVLL